MNEKLEIGAEGAADSLPVAESPKCETTLVPESRGTGSDDVTVSAVPSAPVSKFTTREEWLVAATEKFAATFKAQKAEIPPVQIACGWPSARGLSNKKRSIGQCWDKDCAEDGKYQIFISPILDDVLHYDSTAKDGSGVLPTLAHEIVHAVVGLEAKHGKVFGKMARGIGLEGKMTATNAGEKLLQECADIAKILGPYPHSKINPLMEGGPAPQKNRQLKCECKTEGCGYIARVSKKWILELGAPHCPKHGEMSHDPIDGAEDEGGEDESE